MAELRRYGLLTPADDGYSVHRPVQAVTRHLLTEDGEADAWAIAVTDMLACAVPRPPATAATLATWKRLEPHVRHHLAVTPVPDEPRAHLLRHNLGPWIGESGDAATARDLYAALLADRERILAPGHTLLLLTRQSLAYWTGQAGDPATARDLAAALLPDYQRELGPDHPSTVAARHQLARWTGRAGDPGAAAHGRPLAESGQADGEDVHGRNVDADGGAHLGQDDGGHRFAGG
ncbi:MAG: tetratricopeptide repeat protein [Mycobacteriales bacterium]